MINWLTVSRKDVAQIVAATFPDYRGRKIKVGASADVTLHDLNWSGGTRSQYRTCTVAGQPTGSADRYNHMAPWEKAEGATLPIPAGFVCVEHTFFCGKDSGLRIYVNPADMPKMIGVRSDAKVREEARVQPPLLGYLKEFVVNEIRKKLDARLQVLLAPYRHVPGPCDWSGGRRVAWFMSRANGTVLEGRASTFDDKRETVELTLFTTPQEAAAILRAIDHMLAASGHLGPDSRG